MFVTCNKHVKIKFYHVRLVCILKLINRLCRQFANTVVYGIDKVVAHVSVSVVVPVLLQEKRKRLGSLVDVVTQLT